MRPRMALRAVVFPAPLGPMRPRMRPSSTRRSTPSRATVLPKVLRRPRASIQGMSVLLLLIRCGFVGGGREFDGGGLRCRMIGAILQQFFGIESEALNGG